MHERQVASMDESHQSHSCFVPPFVSFWFIPHRLRPNMVSAVSPPLAHWFPWDPCGLPTCCSGPYCLTFFEGWHSQEHGGPGTIVLVPRIFLCALRALQGPDLQGRVLSLFFIKTFLLGYSCLKLLGVDLMI